MSTIERIPLIVPADAGALGRLALAGHWRARFRSPARRPKTGTIYGWDEWEDEWQNLVVDQGVNDALDVHLSGGLQDTTWFVGLTDGTPTVAAADTLASHVGWAEVTAYDELARQAWADGGVAAKSVSNSAAPATFTISTASTTVGGAFLAGDDAKGGTTGILYAAGPFGAGDVVLNAGATIDITATFTGADDGV